MPTYRIIIQGFYPDSDAVSTDGIKAFMLPAPCADEAKEQAYELATGSPEFEGWNELRVMRCIPQR